MLAKLRAQSESWYKLAAYLPQLTRAGYDSIAIEADTGLEKIQQSVWTVAVEVISCRYARFSQLRSRLPEAYEIRC